jgi:hypothetical protein
MLPLHPSKLQQMEEETLQDLSAKEQVLKASVKLEFNCQWQAPRSSI